jgi:hypothetical protein
MEQMIGLRMADPGRLTKALESPFYFFEEGAATGQKSPLGWKRAFSAMR